MGNDSVYTLFLAVDLDKSYFASKASEHFFYTPSRSGQSLAGPIPISAGQGEIEKWLEKFFALTTYEISIPVMRDDSLAPEGKTGLIISVLFDYQLTRQVEQMGWYEDFKGLCEKLHHRYIGFIDLPGHEARHPAAVQLHSADHGKICRYFGWCHHRMGIQQPSHACGKPHPEDHEFRHHAGPGGVPGWPVDLQPCRATNIPAHR